MIKVIISALLCGLAAAMQIQVEGMDGRKAHLDNIEIRDGVIHGTDHGGRLVQVSIQRLTPSSRVEAIAEFARRLDVKAKEEAARPKGIEVMSLAIKRLPDSWLGPRFRYFFAVRNHEAERWAGKVKIRLKSQNGRDGKLAEFSVDLPAAGGAWGSFDAATGPVKEHGEWGITGFKAEVLGAGGKAAVSSEGKISGKYSDPGEVAKALELLDALELIE